MSKILLITPPMTQLSTPYPATCYLKGFLATQGYTSHPHEVHQKDASLDLALKIFSKAGVLALSEAYQEKRGIFGADKVKTDKVEADNVVSIDHFWRNRSLIAELIEPVIAFLQGKDSSLAYRIVTRNFLPEGPRFNVLGEWGASVLKGSQFEGDQVELEAAGMYHAFGSLGLQDKAKFLASLFIDDLADFISDALDPRFSLSKYAEKLSQSEPTFKPIFLALQGQTLIDKMLDELTDRYIKEFNPTVVGFTAPFPGNVYAAFRMAGRFKKKSKGKIQTILGGGYPNTELRSLAEPKVFDYMDFITLDDGEKPFLCILEYLNGKRTVKNLLRTFVRNPKTQKVGFVTQAALHDIPQSKIGTPNYEGLNLQNYLSLFEMLNPMHRLWSDTRWNKLTLAHGCYWKKCNFCDVTLDYIGRYEPTSASQFVDKMEELKRQTGQSGFHFVDEAAPPKFLKEVALEIIHRGLVVSWWGNIRFEKNFTSELCLLLAKSGCIAISGGLEVASDRLLKLMNKGVTVEQVAQVTRAFTDSGILVHAYLMYGFPSQTAQETIDSLERVRQLFLEGCINSAFWHRFSVTIHSPIGLNPAAFGITLEAQPEVSFARNDLEFKDSVITDHEMLGRGLNRALYNYMHLIGLNEDVRVWFEEKVPKAKVHKYLIRSAMDVAEPYVDSPHLM